MGRTKTPEAPKVKEPINPEILAAAEAAVGTRARVGYKTFGLMQTAIGLILAITPGDATNPNIGPSIAVETDETRAMAGPSKPVEYPADVLAEAVKDENAARMANTHHGAYEAERLARAAKERVLNKYVDARKKDPNLSLTFVAEESVKRGRETVVLAPARWVESQRTEKKVVINVPVRNITGIAPEGAVGASAAQEGEAPRKEDVEL